MLYLGIDTAVALLSLIRTAVLTLAPASLVA